MRFLVDAQLPTAVARWIASRGHDAVHISDLHLQDASDSVIWDLALRESAVIVSKDQDFVDRRTRAKIGPQVVWIRIRNSRKAALLARLAEIFSEIEEGLLAGQTIITAR
jgi:predicted nuclease of predicted toxin-antitoxin system